MNTNSIAMWETLPNNADWNSFKSLTLQEAVEDSKSTSGGFCASSEVTRLCQQVGCARNTFVLCPTELEIMSVGAGSRMDGIPALTLWDLMVEVRTEGPKRELLGNTSAVVKPDVHDTIPIKHTNVIPTNIDHIPSNVTHAGPSAMLFVFEDNETAFCLCPSSTPSMHREPWKLWWLHERKNPLHDSNHSCLRSRTSGNWSDETCLQSRVSTSAWRSPMPDIRISPTFVSQHANVAMTSKDGPSILTGVLALWMGKPQLDGVSSNDLSMEEYI